MDELVNIAITHEDGKQFSTVVSVNEKGEFYKSEQTEGGSALIAGVIKNDEISIGIVRFSGIFPGVGIISNEHYFGRANGRCKLVDSPRAYIKYVYCSTEWTTERGSPYYELATETEQQYFGVIMNSSKMFLDCIKSP